MDGNVETEAEVDPEIVKRYQDAGAILLSGDKARAIEMLRELAAEGVAPAQYTLGNIYLHAEDRAPDADAAMRCYLEAAASGFAPAYWALGNMYLYGSGVDKSARKAADYYMEGVKLGDVDCMVFLAELLASGQLAGC